MTDIERAEKYARENKKIIQCSCHNYDSEKDLEEAYLAGLKAARQEMWHDLRKNPNDLPESSIFHEILNQNGTKMFYDDIFKKWNMYFNGEIVQAQTPITWCEIPIFEE